MVPFYNLKVQLGIILRRARRSNQFLSITGCAYEDRVPDRMGVKFERIGLALRSAVAWQDEIGVERGVSVTIEFKLLQVRG